MSLKNKYVLITGAAKRIGAELAKEMAGRQATVIIHYSQSHKEAFRLHKMISSSGGKALLLQADFSPRANFEIRLKGFIKKVYSLVPRVDVLINNAAIFYPSKLGTISEKIWDDFLTVNLKAPFFISQEIGLKMVKVKSGKIINLVDPSTTRPNVNYLPYAAAKSGLQTMTIGLAKALAPYVQVNAIALGPILPAVNAGKKQHQRAADLTLLKRYGSPKDIAAALKFLVEGSDYVTGAVIPVDGGMSTI